jgi:hypothetical protein
MKWMPTVRGGFVARAVRAAWWPALALAAVAVAAAGCSDSLLSTDANAVVVPANGASYTLVTVNGKTLPVEMRKDSTETVTLVAGELSLAPTTSTFSQRMTIVSTPPVGSAVSRDSYAQGTVTVTGTHVHFRASDGAEWDGAASPGWIVYTVPGNSGPVTFAFRQG